MVAGRGRAVVVAVGPATAGRPRGAGRRRRRAAGRGAGPAGRADPRGAAAHPRRWRRGDGLSLLWGRPLREAVGVGAGRRRRRRARGAAAGRDRRPAGRRPPAVPPGRRRPQRPGAGGARPGGHRLLRQDRHADREPAARGPARAARRRPRRTTSELLRARGTAVARRGDDGGPRDRPRRRRGRGATRGRGRTATRRRACRSPPSRGFSAALARRAAGGQGRARGGARAGAPTPERRARAGAASWPPRGCGCSPSPTGGRRACPTTSTTRRSGLTLRGPGRPGRHAARLVGRGHRAAAAAGVRVLVATGDHPETAGAIAAQAGIPDADRVVTGARARHGRRTPSGPSMVRTARGVRPAVPGAEGARWSAPCAGPARPWR